MIGWGRLDRSVFGSDVVYGFVNFGAYKMNLSQFQSAGFRFVQKCTV